MSIGLIDGLDPDLDIGTKDLPLGAVEGDGMNGRQAVGRQRRPPPLDRVSIVVIA
jgi:hypothetical protein